MSPHLYDLVTGARRGGVVFTTEVTGPLLMVNHKGHPILVLPTSARP